MIPKLTHGRYLERKKCGLTAKSHAIATNYCGSLLWLYDVGSVMKFKRHPAKN